MHDYEFTSGVAIEFLLEKYGEKRWVQSSIEHNGQDYYLMNYSEVVPKGLRVRIKRVSRLGTIFLEKRDMHMQLFLEDLKGLTDQEVRQHIKSEYRADTAEIDRYNILIAYESVGSWGCDSASFFLLVDKVTNGPLSRK